jgi:hypothetical protein
MLADGSNRVGDGVVEEVVLLYITGNVREKSMFYN